MTEAARGVGFLPRLAIGLAILAAAVFLFFDSFTYALYPKTADRPRGCYTKVEVLLGARQPDTTRAAEQWLALASPFLAVGFFIFAAPDASDGL